MFEFLNLDPTIIDPNLVYILLFIGLWGSVTAVKIPGTGIPEVIAALGLIGSVILMSALATNWVAALLVVVGLLAFIVLPFINERLRLLAIGGLVLQAAGSVLLFSDRPVSLIVIVTTMAIQLGYYYLVLLPILERVHSEEVYDRDSHLIGSTGKVVKALDPVGTVNIGAELWTATSERPLQAGDEVVVIEREGLKLVVEGVKHKRTPNSDDAEEGNE